MKIYNHNIKASSIIGIGPLMTSVKSQTIGVKRSLFFMVYTTSLAIQISTNDRHVTGIETDEEKQELKDLFSKFTEEYDRVLKIVLCFFE